MSNPEQPLHTRRVHVTLEYEVTCGDTINLSVEEIFSAPMGRVNAKLLKSHIEIIDPATGQKIGEDMYVRTP